MNRSPTSDKKINFYSLRYYLWCYHQCIAETAYYSLHTQQHKFTSLFLRVLWHLYGCQTTLLISSEDLKRLRIESVANHCGDACSNNYCSENNTPTTITPLLHTGIIISDSFYAKTDIHKMHPTRCQAFILQL